MLLFSAILSALALSVATHLFFEQRHQGKSGSIAAAAMALSACGFLITISAFTIEAALRY